MFQDVKANSDYDDTHQFISAGHDPPHRDKEEHRNSPDDGKGQEPDGQAKVEFCPRQNYVYMWPVMYLNYTGKSS